MNNVTTSIRTSLTQWPLIALLGILALTGCSSDITDKNDPNLINNGNFEIRSLTEQLDLTEGDQSGLRISLTLERSDGYDSSVDLSISGVSSTDSELITSNFTQLSLSPDADSSELVLTLAIADLPILAQQREFIVTASDGTNRDDLLLHINVLPVNAPDVYLLIGQSNMVGFSGDGTRQAYVGGADEPNARIKQLNVSENDRYNLFLSQADFLSPTVNVASPSITVAEDPLHIPLDPSSEPDKSEEYIGLGLSFAKRALPNTSRDIILVPAAWSSSSFCASTDGPNGQWNAQATTNPELGNTWLYDRAVTRINLALQETSGILRGILWHQGESDSNDRCGEFYAQNLEQLVYQLRTNINTDLRGSALRQTDSNIPFVVGTMSRGIDERDDLSVFWPSKQLVDNAHRNLPNVVPHAGLSIHDDLTPANGYPCGNTTCIHFGAEALREMGSRYYDALLDAVGS